MEIHQSENQVRSASLPSTILFVDDEKYETKYFTKALGKEFTILTANSVAGGIDVLEQNHQDIAVVITDQRMPERHGLELLQHTQKHYPQIIRMLTTAFCDTQSAIGAINEAEVFRYIAKPWDIDQLATALDQALKRFTTLNNATRMSFEERLLLELDEDCRHWLMYVLHAYGDEAVYKSGLEALACRYYARINRLPHAIDNSMLVRKIDKLIDDHYLTEKVMYDVNNHRDSGFGINNDTGSSSH